MHEISWPPPGLSPERLLNRLDRLDPARTALIVIDLQTSFVSEGFPGYCAHARDVMANVNRLAAALRRRRGLVVHTRHTTLDDPERGPPPWQRAHAWMDSYFKSLEPGAAGHALHPELEVAPEDLVLDKVRYSAFLPVSSSLDAELRARGLDTVIIVGALTNICCESSARDAHMIGYKVFFAADATAAITDESHNASLATLGLCFADVRWTDELLELIAAA